MPRLYRPHIPLETRCRVVLRQLGEMWPDKVIEAERPQPSDGYLKGVGAFVTRRGFKVLLVEKLELLADLLDCKVEDLHLDHDPALATREKKLIGLTGRWRYAPDANDPEHLIYREKHAHHIKTNVRGDGAQFPDRVLIKRERRRTRKTPKKKFKWQSRPLRSAARWPKRKMSQPSTGDRKS